MCISACLFSVYSCVCMFVCMWACACVSLWYVCMPLSPCVFVCICVSWSEIMGHVSGFRRHWAIIQAHIILVMPKKEPAPGTQRHLLKVTENTRQNQLDPGVQANCVRLQLPG